MRTTPHFELLIDREKVSRLDSLAPLAEAAWSRLAQATGYRPEDPIRVVFHDEDEYANGWAYAANSWVNVWLEPVPFALRGSVDWVSDVLSHELAHVFTLQALGLDGRLLAITAVGGVDLAHAQGQADLSMRFDDLESWLAEGLAQIGAESCGSDSWDPQRDALEHVAWKSGRTLPDGLLRTFWGDARESELVYNQGYSFLRWVLSQGKTDLPGLLVEGRKSGLREAIAKTLGMSFARALESWRADLRRRHGDPTWPAEPGRAPLDHDRGATWTYEPGAVADGAGTIWISSSRDNDYGLSELWEIRGGKRRKLVDDIAGRPSISPDGSVLGVVRSRTRPDRRNIQDLWEYGTATGSWRRVTLDARVVDAAACADGFALVVRTGGANRLRRLDRRGSELPEVPAPPYGDPVQVACGGTRELVATAMGRDGFRLFRLVDGNWSSVGGDPAERRDPAFAAGRLWYSRLEGGRWTAASMGADGAERTEVRSEGGATAPFPLGNDSLLVSRIQPEGFLVVIVHAGSPESFGPMPVASAPLDRSPLVGSPVRWKKGDPIDPPGLSGYGFQLGYLARRRSGAAFDPGSKWIAGGGVWFANSTMENSLELDAQLLHGGVGEKAGWDESVALSIDLEGWSPVIRASGSYSRITLEHRAADTTVDNLFQGDILPYLVEVQTQASVLQRLDTRTSAYLLWSWTSLGVGATGITSDATTSASLDLLDQQQVLAGLQWQSFEPGRHGPLSGAGIQVSGGWITETVVGGASASAMAGLGEIRLATNLHRRLLLGMDATGQVLDLESGPRGQGAVDVSAGLPIPIPAFSIPLTSHRRWTFVDPILRVGNTTTALPASSSLDGLVATPHLDPQQQGGATFAAAPLQVQPWRAGQDTKLLQTATVELDWNVVGLGNGLGTWSAGVDIPSWDGDFARRLRWRASISL